MARAVYRKNKNGSYASNSNNGNYSKSDNSANYGNNSQDPFNSSGDTIDISDDDLPF